MTERKTLIISLVTVLAVIPMVSIVGLLVFGDKSYPFISAAVAVLACIPFFMSFEGGRTDARRLMLVAVMIALSVIGRIAFAEIPFVKPVAAMTVFAGMYLGAQAGFVTGALTAVISNIYFGQGPYTPFQMIAWGLIGFFAGILSKRLDKSVVLLAIYGVVAGIGYSIILDVYSAMWESGDLSMRYFIASVAASTPFTITYAVSNVIFLVLLKRPIGAALSRLGIKYGL